MDVAVLLATYNGERFVEQQLKSLRQNATEFVVHWIDDHSTDRTRDIVRSTAQAEHLQLREWHQANHLGVPAAFFELMEHVSADIYLFCDQDDIWQPGKIDVTVQTLTPDVGSPVLVCSDFYMFRNQEPDKPFRLSQIVGLNAEEALSESRLFMALIANGHTQGFTRALRDIYLSHRQIARSYAYMHDEWMHVIATASGEVRFLSGSPTTLFRWHGGNTSGAFFVWKGQGAGYLESTWKQRQVLRRAISRHAQGFLLASPTLPGPERVKRLESIARWVATLEKRQPLGTMFRMLHQGVMWPNPRLALGLSMTCMCGDATSEASTAQALS
jgi:rhamnosyltransferase